MPWEAYPDVDDTLTTWLKAQYTTFRNTLSNPQMPEEADVDWDTFWAGTHTASFMVWEGEPTKHPNFALGTKTIQFEGFPTIRVTYRWIHEGKPPALKEIREFLTKTLHFNISPLPNDLRTAGIYWMIVLSSRMYPATNSAQEDFWVLDIRLATKVLNNIT